MSDASAPNPGTSLSLAHDRTEMASFRTSLALERTTLAWVRTTLSMTSFGLGMIGFFRSLRQQKENPQTIRLHEAAIHFGTALVIVGFIATVFVVITHAKTVRQLQREENPTLTLWPPSIMLAMLLALMGMYGLWNVFGY
jgi:putative membrane protein